MRTLYLKLVTKHHLEEEWKQILPESFKDVVLISCNKEGKVNYEKTLLYSLHELNGRRIVIL